MRRENKLALIVGFSVLLVVAVLVSDHLSEARRDEVADGMSTLPELPNEGVLLRSPLAAAGRLGGPTESAAPPAARPTPVAPPPETTFLAESSPIEPPARSVERPVRVDEAEPLIIANGTADDSDGWRPSAGGMKLPFDPSKIAALLQRTERTEPDRRVVLPADPVVRRGEPGGLVEQAGVYVVKDGDTLYEICERLYGAGSKWQDMAALNEGRVGPKGQVYPGVTLKLLPGVRTESGVSGRAAATRETARSEPPRSVRTRTYTVKKGDTLSEIAQREAGSVSRLAEIRDLNPSLKANGDKIFVGQKLVLPSGGRG